MGMKGSVRGVLRKLMGTSDSRDRVRDVAQCKRTSESVFSSRDKKTKRDNKNVWPQAGPEPIQPAGKSNQKMVNVFFIPVQAGLAWICPYGLDRDNKNISGIIKTFGLRPARSLFSQLGN